SPARHSAHRARHPFPTTTLFRSSPRPPTGNECWKRPTCPTTCRPVSTVSSSNIRDCEVNPPPTPSSCVPRNWACVHPRRQCSRRSEEHTSELQSRENLVCRLLLE